MPYEIGKPIFDKMLSAPRPDFERMKVEAKEAEQELRRVKIEKVCEQTAKLQSNRLALTVIFPRCLIGLRLRKCLFLFRLRRGCSQCSRRCMTPQI